MSSTRHRSTRPNRDERIILGLGAITLIVALFSVYRTHWDIWGLAAGGLGLSLIIFAVRRLSQVRAEAEQRARHLITLSAISDTMRASLDLPELLEAIRQRIEQLLDAPIFFVALYDADMAQVSFPLYSENGQPQHVKPRPIGNSLLGYVIRTHQPLLIRQDIARTLEQLGLESPDPMPACWMGAPILTTDRVLGVMAAQSWVPRAYSKNDLELFTTVASQAAIAISNAQLYSTLRQRATELAILNSASSAIGATLDLERVLEIITDSIFPVTGCQKSAIFLLNESGDEIRLAKSRGLSPSYIEDAQRIKVRPGERGMVAALHKPLVVSDVNTTPHLQGFASLAQTEGYRALAEVPMIAQNGVIGTLAVYYTDPHPFTQAELDVLQTFANQAAAAVNNARLYERTDQALARRVEEMTALAEISREFTGTLEVARIAESIVDRTMQITGAQTATLMLVHEGAPHGHFVAQRGYPLQSVESFFQKPWPLMQGVIGRAIRTGQAINVPDTRLDPDYVTIDPDTRSLLVVPIMREGHALGVITLGGYQLDAFDRAAVTFTQQIANQAAIALENARLFAERTQRVSELSQLYQASLALTESLDLQQVLEHIVSVACQLSGADTIALHLYQPDTDSFQRGASTGTLMPGDSTVGIRPQGMTRRALQQRRPILIRDTHKESDINPRLVAIGIRSLILVPLISHDQVWGVLNAYSCQSDKFTQADVQLVSALGNQAAAAIENARLFQTVAEVRDKMRAILDSSREGILMFDLSGRVVMANPALEKLLGIRRDLVEGRLLIEMLERPGLDIATQLGYSPPAILAALDQLKRSEHLSDTHDVYQIAHPTPRFVERSGISVRDAVGKTVGWMIVLRDVTEERELQQMRSDLTSMIIHDLRSPLSAIYSGLLMLREMTPACSSDLMVQDTFAAAEHSCLRLLNMVNSLLDISKLEAGRLKLDQQPTDLRKLMTGVLDGLAPLAQEHGIQLVCHIPEAWFVLVDEDKISRVVTNLVDNALKFTAERGTVRIVAEPAPGEPGFIRCGVQDEGPGIPPEYRDRIFDRFAQGPSQSGKRRGTGLGLALCKLMVEAHGGRIWVESHDRQGSTFYFTLPQVMER